MGLGYATIEGVGKDQGTPGMPRLNLGYVYGMGVRTKVPGITPKVGSGERIVCT